MGCKMRSISALSFCAAVLCLTLSAFGCEDDMSSDAGHDHDHDSTVMIGPPSGATCPSDSTLTYDNFGKDFVGKYCLRCHSDKVTGTARNKAPADHNFDKLSDIALLVPHIDQYAAAGPASTNTKMPPDGAKPSTDERKQLGEWLACGTP
jgi:hypothetical protein